MQDADGEDFDYTRALAVRNRKLESREKAQRKKKEA